MEVTIVDNLDDAVECRRVMDAYYEFQNNELSKSEWENATRYPRKQWLTFDKTEALPFVVIDNREGECFVEDFETLDGALQYILDIHVTSEDQEKWDVYGAINELGGWGIGGVSEDDTPLHELVLTFARCDNDVARYGRDGGAREERWEVAKANMIAEAERLSAQGKEEKCS